MWAKLSIFLASAVVIWVAGIWLSQYTDVLADRLHLGQALGGLILLAVATNLPEIAITYSAAASGKVDVAVSNILGGIAIQTVVLADHVGLSGVPFGATVLAMATSLPELSTGLTSVRQGDYKLAFGDIFGGNAFLPVLFLLAVLVSGKAVLPNAHASDIYLTGLGALLPSSTWPGWCFARQDNTPASASTASSSWCSTSSGVIGLVAQPR